MPRFVAALIALLVFGVNAAAQVQQGDPRVRVTFGCVTDCEQVIGTVVQFTSDSMVIREEGRPGTRRLALASVSRYELDRGPQQNKVGVMAGVGVVVGLVGGGVVGFLTDEPETSGCGVDLPSDSTLDCDAGGALIGAGIGLAIGAGVGFLIGKMMTPDRWVEMDLGYAQLGAGPRGLGRFGLDVSFPF
jgi:hypothetical protein